MTTLPAVPAPNVGVQNPPASYDHLGTFIVVCDIDEAKDGSVAAKLDEAMQNFKRTEGVGLVFDYKQDTKIRYATQPKVYMIVSFRYVRTVDLAAFTAAIQPYQSSLLLNLLLSA